MYGFSQHDKPRVRNLAGGLGHTTDTPSFVLPIDIDNTELTIAWRLNAAVADMFQVTVTDGETGQVFATSPVLIDQLIVTLDGIPENVQRTVIRLDYWLDGDELPLSITTAINRNIVEPPVTVPPIGGATGWMDNTFWDDTEAWNDVG